MKVNISFATLLVFALILSSSILIYPATAYVTSGYCKEKCGNRCAKAGRQDRCMKYCGICCDKCKCVPSGTYGNKHECPCYRDQRSSKGTPKCP